jgi:hypothetical protein
LLLVSLVVFIHFNEVENQDFSKDSISIFFEVHEVNEISTPSRESVNGLPYMSFKLIFTENVS